MMNATRFSAQRMLAASQKQQIMMSVNSFGVNKIRSVMAYANAPIAVGQKLPESTFNYFDSDKEMRTISTKDLCEGKKVVLLGVPAAFSPTCSMKHVPSFIEKAGELKGKGIDTIACISVNDAFVMDAWAKELGAGEAVMLLADGSAEFTNAIGAQLDLTDKGLGIRSRRYAMVVEDMEVKKFNLEDGGAFTVSSAESVLNDL